MKELNRSPVLVQLLAALIQADLVKAIENMPHLSTIERRIAVGRALRKGVVDELVRDLITEEIKLAELDREELSEDLVDAFLATTTPVFSA